MTSALSYVHGASDVEFIGATIGAYFDGDRQALSRP